MQVDYDPEREVLEGRHKEFLKVDGEVLERGLRELVPSLCAYLRGHTEVRFNPVDLILILLYFRYVKVDWVLKGLRAGDFLIVPGCPFFAFNSMDPNFGTLVGSCFLRILPHSVYCNEGHVLGGVRCVSVSLVTRYAPWVVGSQKLVSRGSS